MMGVQGMVIVRVESRSEKIKDERTSLGQRTECTQVDL